MKVTLEVFDPANAGPSGAKPRSPLHAQVEQIKDDANLHRKLLTIATFDKLTEEGQAHSQKQNLNNYYGNDIQISGFVFSVVTSIDNSEQYLVAFYNPDAVVPGALDQFKAMKREKAAEAKRRKDEREAEQARIRAEAEDGEEDEGEEFEAENDEDDEEAFEAHAFGNQP